jgi:hypothetical protein
MPAKEERFPAARAAGAFEKQLCRKRREAEEKIAEDIAEPGDQRGSPSIFRAPGWHDPGLLSG